MTTIHQEGSIEVREQLAEFYIHAGMVHFALRDYSTAIAAWDKVGRFSEDLGLLAQSYIETARRERAEPREIRPA